MQDPGGQKYIAFHQELFGNPGPAGREKALAAAKDQGLDMTRLEQDMASDESVATIKEGVQLASAVGITGTPGYVIGKQVVYGAVGIAELKRQINTARGAGGAEVFVREMEDLGMNAAMWPARPRQAMMRILTKRFTCLPRNAASSRCRAISAI